MASNILTQLPGLNKLPFGLGKGVESPPSSALSSGGYRARKSISETHRLRSESQMSISLVNKGLLNPTGENNCFLNSAVQILWHIDVFRRSFRKIKSHMCVERACIFCALKELFNEFQHGKQSVIPPDTLRQAMADCYEEQHRFQLGLMDDAAECFEKILEQVHLHLTGSEDMDTCSSAYCLSHQKFSLTILERTECVCGATSEPLSFIQFVHYISSSAIAKEAQKYAKHSEEGHAPSSDADAKGPKSSDSDPAKQDEASTPVVVAGSGGSTAPRPRLSSASQVHFGRILNQASAFGEFRPCPDYERCKKTVAVKRILLNCPDVVCLGMIWDSDRPSVEEIMSVVLSIGLTLQLSDLFDHVFSDAAQFNQYELTALIAYYGRHYSTFCYHSKMREWVYFDDAKFRTVGKDWADVCDEIRRAHYQPLLLVYTNPFADEIDMSDAPKIVTKSISTPIPSHQGGVATQPLSSIKEETVASEDASQSASKEGQAAATTKGAEPRTKGVEPSKTMTKSNQILTNNSPASQTARPCPPKPRDPSKAAILQPSTHTIDPLTLSLVPIQHGTETGTKLASPIVQHNLASATPTSAGGGGTTPTSAREFTLLSGGSDALSSDDLMSFSISPAILLGSGAKTKTVPTGEHQLELSPAGINNDVNDDLIKFSLSPALLGTLHAQQGLSGRKSHATVQHGSQVPGSHSHSMAPGSRGPVLFAQQSHSNPRATSSNSTKLLSQSPAVTDDSHQLRPHWEHFSDESLKPVAVAPQKLLQPTSKVGGVGSHSNQEVGVKPGEKSTQGSWTVITKSGKSQEGSKAVRQLQRVASQPGFGGAVGASDSSIRELMVESLVLGDEEKKATSRTSWSKHLPPPVSSEQGKEKSDARAMQDLGKPAAKTSLLEDLEFAFPTAENMFGKSAGGEEAKVNGDDRKFDYADLDLEVVAASQVGVVSSVRGVVSPKHDPVSSKADYAVIRYEEPRYEFEPPKTSGGPKSLRGADLEAAEEGDYSRLVDVSVDGWRDSSQPIGNDPLYSVPDKAKRSTSAGSEEVPIGADPMYAIPAKVMARSNADVSASSAAQLRDSTREAVTDLNLSVRGKLHDAQDLFAKAEASAGNDDVVAMVLYQQFSTLMFQVLQDPKVIATPTLYQQIKSRREEGVKRCLALQTSRSGPSTEDLPGHCKGCGHQRDLNEQRLCGPCQLREKLKRR